MDCFEFLFGHPRGLLAISKLKSGGAYEELLHTDDMQDGDIAVLGFRANWWHCGRVRNNKIVGKDDRDGDVTGATRDQYESEGYWVKLYRLKAGISRTSHNDPFDPTH